MAEVQAQWTTGAQCVATDSGGHSIVMDAPMARSVWNGFKPSELLLAALLGCAGADFGAILAKQRQHVSQVSARACAEQDADAPWAFRRIELIYTVRGRNLDRAKAERALELAVTRYCSVGATLSGVATIHHRVEIQHEQTTDVYPANQVNLKA